MKRIILIMLFLSITSSLFAISDAVVSMLAINSYAVGKKVSEDKVHNELYHNTYIFDHYEEKDSLEKTENGFCVFHYKTPIYRYEKCEHTFADNEKAEKNFIRGATSAEIKKIKNSLVEFPLLVCISSALAAVLMFILKKIHD